jgi:general L-amino acid transport system permease protein
MASVQALPPPRSIIGPLPWLKQNLFSTWYNGLLTLLAMAAVVTLVRSALTWAAGEARWGAITSNLTLFMIGQYPRDQLWRIWLVIYLLALLIGSSWGLWKAAVRGFALIALGAATVFALSALQTDIWPIWAGVALIIALGYLAGPRIAHLRRAVVVGWIVYFPLSLLLISGSPLVPFLPPVDLNLWGGLLLTLALTVVGNIGALPLGILLALGRRSRLPALRAFCIGYIELIRGVPLITILYMAANMLPFFLPEGVRPDLVIRAMVGLVMFEAAYQAENVRGGLQAIPRGQYEAAHALGLNTTLTTVLVILPQALRLVIPGIVNSFISLFKDTSLVFIMGLYDLLNISRLIVTGQEWLGKDVESYIFAGFGFWIFCFAMSRYSLHVERKLDTGHRR